MADSLLPFPLTENTVHLCVDMQRLFSTEGPWPTPWMERVLPVVAELAGRFPERTVFTRFITPRQPDDMPGMWQRYYRRWECTTQARIDPALLELMPPLARLVPAASVIDKTRYSGFAEPHSSRPRSRRPDRHRLGNRCVRIGDGVGRGRSRLPGRRGARRHLQLIR
jgi:nicotinamidase-related amidase